MKKVILIVSAVITLFGFQANAGDRPARPKFLFSMSDGLLNPESAVTYGDFIFVSNIGEKNPAKKDGDGWIQMISLDGKKSEKWLPGLNDPKGLRISDGKLHISDLDEVVIADLGTGKLIERISVKGAEFLNDVEVDDNGNIYASDTKRSSVFIISGRTRKVSALLKDMDEAPNGLIYKDNKLYVASWAHKLNPKDWSFKKPGSFIYVSLPKKSVHSIIPAPLGALDGLENISDSLWVLSDKTGGRIYLVDSENGERETLLENVADVADIGYDKKLGLLLLPLMKSNELQIYSFR